MRWSGQELTAEAADALPGLAGVKGLVRSVTTPEFAGVRFHEVLARSALNRVPAGIGGMGGVGWTINPYRGCSHACRYCFARPTHTWLELDAGDDFDREIVVKTNVAEVLRRELARPSWAREAVALGTNTDPYQRAEGRYALMPGIIEALAASGTPFSILTKGPLLKRDLALIARAAEEVDVGIAFSIAVYDDELQQSVEPGTPRAEARLAAVKAVREAGLECSVFLMPVLPYLTDTVAHLDRALGMVAAAGATTALVSALHLKPGVKDVYLAWLGREHPELLPRYEAMYASSAYAPADYRRWLSDRVRPLLARHGLRRGREDPATGGVGPATTRVRRSGRGVAPAAGGAARFPSRRGANEAPTLF